MSSLEMDFHVIFVNQPSDDENNEILQNIFDNKVHIVTSIKDAMLSIHSKDQKPTIVLIDIDHYFSFFEKLCQSIQYYNHHIIPIACSKSDSTSLMIQAIQIGASDFILKPFREPVLKTMFLHVYRHQRQLASQQQQPEQPSMMSQFQGRLDKLYGHEDEHWLPETIIRQYTPPPTIKERPSMDLLSSERKIYLNQFICDWNFSPLDLDEQELIYCVFSMLNQTFLQFSPALDSLKMTDDALYDLILDVCNGYHNVNPYHNFRHAVDVMQSTWYFLCSIQVLHAAEFSETHIPTAVVHSDKASALLRPIDILGLLMASLGHDVGHPGVNNGFMVSTATPLAVLYNDKSVLESYHSMAFFNLLKRHYFKAMIDINSHPEYKTFRSIVVHSILCTDMGCHHDYVQNIRKQIERIRTSALDLSDDTAKDKERLVICSAIMKCADISNCARPFENAKRWALLLSEEFCLQGDLERELGIPSIPINERGKVTLADFQLSFMNNVALDLFKSVGELFPALEICVDNIQENIKLWQQHT